MGSINPVFILENKVKKDITLPTALASSITQGTGQFCTNPGLIVICDSDPETEFAKQVPRKPFLEEYRIRESTLDSGNAGQDL